VIERYEVESGSMIYRIAHSSSVYLFMFFRYDVEQTVKCKVSKYIKAPFVKAKDSKPSECDVIHKYLLPLYTVMRSNHQTIFYTKNNLAYFYEGMLKDDEKLFHTTIIKKKTIA